MVIIYHIPYKIARKLCKKYKYIELAQANLSHDDAAPPITAHGAKRDLRAQNTIEICCNNVLYII